RSSSSGLRPWRGSSGGASFAPRAAGLDLGLPEPPCRGNAAVLDRLRTDPYRDIERYSGMLSAPAAARPLDLVRAVRSLSGLLLARGERPRERLLPYRALRLFARRRPASLDTSSASGAVGLPVRDQDAGRTRVACRARTCPGMKDL